MLKKDIKIMITGGGSGGHLSVVKSNWCSHTRLQYSIPNIIYVGGDLGMEGERNSLEQRLFKDAKFKTYYIRAGKLQRKLSLNTISLLFRSILGFLIQYLL